MDSLFETLKNLGPARLGVMLLSLMALVVFFIFIAIRSSEPSMSLLYSNLSPEDTTAIAGKLDLSNIPFRIEKDGKEIMVSYQQVGKARMLLAEEGLPSNASMGYELFDKQQKFGTTSLVQNINKLRALEGELGRTIRTLDIIQNARVHLVLPQRELFSKDKNPATASVFIKLQNSQQLEKSQILAIQHLVAAAVPKLKPENVAVVDSNGTLLAAGNGDEYDGALGGNSDLMRVKYERKLKNSLEEMISRIVGYGNVKVTVSADLDFDVISSNSEIYDPEGQVLRSSQTVTEEEKDSTGSNNSTVTVQNNLPGGLSPLADSGVSEAGSSRNRSEEIVNYEISKTIKNVVQEVGEVRKLSIAVLVDGKYEEIPLPEDADKDAVPEKKYIPRDKAEIDKIASLVKAAVGYDEIRGDKVEVINMQFANIKTVDDGEDEELVFGILRRDELMQFAETVMLSIVALLVVLLVLRPLVNHIATTAQSVAEQNKNEIDTSVAMLEAHMGGGNIPSEEGNTEEEDEEASLDMHNVEGKVKASTMRKVSELVEGHPAEAVSVIRSWMTQEG